MPSFKDCLELFEKNVVNNKKAKFKMGKGKGGTFIGKENDDSYL
jgi:hypothetical protein